MIKLSKRMKAVAAMVTSNGILADVGTDHGYVPIALVQRQKIPGAIAMDINTKDLSPVQKKILQRHIWKTISRSAFPMELRS